MLRRYHGNCFLIRQLDNKEKTNSEILNFEGVSSWFELYCKVKRLGAGIHNGEWGCDHIDKYERIEQVGEGTYGQVFKAIDKTTGEIVALKRIALAKQNEGFPITTIRELKILKALQDCENIVKLKDVVTSWKTTNEMLKKGTDHGAVYCVFEFIEHDLAGMLSMLHSKSTWLEIGETKSYAKQLLTALQYCHSHQILHRDIKASNILINNRGVLKLCDFGLARAHTAPDPNYTNRVVTLWYRPPELLVGATSYGTKVDIWSTGCIIAEMLLKRPLFTGRNEVDQLEKIFKLCGTPTPATWPEFSKLPYSGFWLVPNKFFQPCFYDCFRRFPVETRDLMRQMLALDPNKRPSATECLNHKFFFTEPLPIHPDKLPTYPSAHDFSEKKKRADLQKQQQQIKIQQQHQQQIQQQQQQQTQQFVMQHYQQQQQPQHYQYNQQKQQQGQFPVHITQQQATTSLAFTQNPFDERNNNNNNNNSALTFTDNQSYDYNRHQGVQTNNDNNANNNFNNYNNNDNSRSNYPTMESSSYSQLPYSSLKPPSHSSQLINSYVSQYPFFHEQQQYQYLQPLQPQQPQQPQPQQQLQPPSLSYQLQAIPTTTPQTQQQPQDISYQLQALPTTTLLQSQPQQHLAQQLQQQQEQQPIQLVSDLKSLSIQPSVQQQQQPPTLSYQLQAIPTTTPSTVQTHTQPQQSTSFGTISQLSQPIQPQVCQLEPQQQQQHHQHPVASTVPPSQLSRPLFPSQQQQQEKQYQQQSYPQEQHSGNLMDSLEIPAHLPPEILPQQPELYPQQQHHSAIYSQKSGNVFTQKPQLQQAEIFPQQLHQRPDMFSQQQRLTHSDEIFTQQPEVYPQQQRLSHSGEIFTRQQPEMYPQQLHQSGEIFPQPSLLQLSTELFPQQQPLTSGIPSQPQLQSTNNLQSSHREIYSQQQQTFPQMIDVPQHPQLQQQEQQQLLTGAHLQHQLPQQHPVEIQPQRQQFPDPDPDPVLVYIHS